MDKGMANPDLRVNDKQLQTANLVNLFDDIYTDCQRKQILNDDNYWAGKLSPLKLIQGR